MLAITGHIFLTIALGYLAVKSKIIPREGVRFFASFALYIALPALIFKSISERSVQQIFQLEYLLVYAAASLTAFLLVYVYAKRVLREDMTSSSVLAMGGSFSNSLMIGYPVLFVIFGDVASIPLALCLLVENFLLMPLTLALGDIGRHKKENFIAAFIGVFPGLVRNPIILAIAAGFIFSLFSLELPLMASKVVDLFSSAAPAIALFTIGGLLVGSKVASLGKKIPPVLITKLILHPLLVTMFILFFPSMDPMLKTSMIIMASMPMFAGYPVIGQRYELGSVCAPLLVVTTLCSFVTINLAIWLVN